MGRGDREVGRLRGARAYMATHAPTLTGGNTMQQQSPWMTTYLPVISTIVVAGATVALVWLTSRYVRLTGRMVEESQKSREPSVTVDFEIPDRSLRLVVENHGLSPAKNVRIAVLKEVQWVRSGKAREGLAECGAVKNGISYLTPSRKLKYYLGFPNWNDISDGEMEASLRITYENEAGKEYHHIVDFDFRQLHEVLFESFKDPALAVAEAIQQSERDRRLQEHSRRMFDSLVAPREMKKCQACAELIPKEAKKCAHCQEKQENSDPTTG